MYEDFYSLQLLSYSAIKLISVSQNHDNQTQPRYFAYASA